MKKINVKESINFTGKNVFNEVLMVHQFYWTSASSATVVTKLSAGWGKASFPVVENMLSLSFSFFLYSFHGIHYACKI